MEDMVTPPHKSVWRGFCPKNRPPLLPAALGRFRTQFLKYDRPATHAYGFGAFHREKNQLRC